MKVGMFLNEVVYIYVINGREKWNFILVKWLIWNIYLFNLFLESLNILLFFCFVLVFIFIVVFILILYYVLNKLFCRYILLVDILY